MEDKKGWAAYVQYANVLGDIDRASDPESPDLAEDPVDAVELETAESLVNLSKGHAVDAAELLVDLRKGGLFALRKTLTESDVNVESLRLAIDQATLLFPHFSRESFTVRGRSGRIYTIKFKISDENGRKYNEMKFVGYLGKKVNRNTPARITCEIKGQWRRFVGQNRLMKGDQVCIYRNLLAEEDDLHFIFKVVHKEGGKEKER